MKYPVERLYRLACLGAESLEALGHKDTARNIIEEANAALDAYQAGCKEALADQAEIEREMGAIDWTIHKLEGGTHDS